MQVGRANLHQGHAHFARQKPRQGRFELRVGKEEDRLSIEQMSLPCQCLPGALSSRCNRGLESIGGNIPGLRGGSQPGGGAFFSKRKQRVESNSTARFKRTRRIGQKGLCQQKSCVGTHRRIFARFSRRKESHRPDANFIEQPLELVFNNVGQGAHDQERRLGFIARRHGRDQSSQTGIFPLGEGGLDAAPRVVENPDGGFKLPRKALGGTRQIELDHLRRARPDQKQKLDIGAPFEQTGDHLVEFGIGIGQPSKVALINDCRREPGFRKNHDARSRLDQMGAGSRTYHQKKRVLNLAVQPDDAREAAKDLALAALAKNWDNGVHAD